MGGGSTNRDTPTRTYDYDDVHVDDDDDDDDEMVIPTQFSNSSFYNFYLSMCETK